MKEKISHHKKIKGLSALAASAVLFSACSLDNAPKTQTSEPVATNGPLQTLEVITPAPETTTGPIIEVTPPPTEKPETPSPTEVVINEKERDASVVALSQLLFLLQSPQEYSGEDYHVFIPNVKNEESLQVLFDNFMQGKTENVPVNFTWTGGGAYPFDSSDKMTAIKTTGKMTISNIQIRTLEGPITNSDKADGVEWKGQVYLNFDFSYAENQYRPTDPSKGYDAQEIKEWLKTPGEDPFLDMSSVATIEFPPQTIVHKNDNSWTNLSTNIYNAGSFNPLNKAKLPLPLIADPSVCENPNVVSSCQIIYKDKLLN